MSLPTQSEVARKLGLSQATVSRALAGKERVPAEVIERVRREAAKLGYRADPLLAALTRRRKASAKVTRGMVAWVGAQDKAEAWRWRSPSNVAHRAGVRARALELGFSYTEVLCEATPLSPERLTKVLLARGADMLVVGPRRFLGDPLALDWSRFAAVALGFTLIEPALDRVASFHLRTGQRAVREALERGYVRIGLWLTEDVDRRVRGGLRAGVCEVLLAEGKWWPGAVRVQPGGTPSRSDFEVWLKRERPDCVISFGAEEIHGWAASGTHAPAGFITVAGAMAGEGVSGFDEGPETIGRIAFDTVAGSWLAGQRGIPHLSKICQIEAEWCEGATLPRQKRPRKVNSSLRR